MLEHTRWYVAFLAVLGLLIAAGQMAWQQRGEPARRAAEGLLTLVVVSGASVTGVALATQAGDAYSEWIITRALGSADFGGAVTRMASLQTVTLTPGLMIIIAILAIISSLFQIVLMLARVAMLGLLTASLQLGAAISSTAEGRAWFKRMLGWLIAFVLYKPVAATIYAFSFTALGTPNSALAQLSGIVMIILAGLALPALMRFFTPLVAATTRGGSGGAAGMLASGAVAMGARMVPAL
ncbi:hypothetical protein TR74_24295, partial [Carbonactinospora thermoautotrophica]